VSAEHVLAFMMVKHRDPGTFTAESFARAASEALSTALIAGERSAREVLKLSGIEVRKPAELIPFDPEARRALRKDERDLEKIRRQISHLRAGGKVENLTLRSALEVESGLLWAIRAKKRLLGSK